MKYINTPEDALKELLPLATTKRSKVAIEVLVKHLNMQEDRDKQSHWLFGKLWLYMFDRNLIYFKSSQGAIDSIRMALSQPMDNYFSLISDTYDGKVEPGDVRVKLSEKINLMLNDKKLYS